MLELFTCPQGHQWQLSADVPTVVPEAPVACPICGAALVRNPAAEVWHDTLPPEAMPPLVKTVPSPTLPSGAAPAESAPPELPTVPGYEILGILGRGGMGVVYKARQLSLNRVVALKMILAGVHASPQLLLRFHLEAEAVARLQHPNIVQIYEVGAHERCPYFSLEFMEGGSLADEFAGQPQPPRRAAALVEQLARAMHSAHQRGIIHRDLKPANILLSADGVAKITDFGLAKRLEETGQTQSGAILGTPSYMAPEQAAGNVREIGPATDVYALGAILYELLSGRPPFCAKTTMETLQEVQSREPQPLTRGPARVPHDLGVICLKCLEKEPRKRYASAEALADDLQRFLRGAPIQARPVSAWERAVKWAKRRPALAALLGVSGLSVLSLLVVSLVYNARLQSALDEAQDNFQTARRAVDKMLTVLAEEHLADKPHMEEKQKELLEEALAIYQKFLRARSADPVLREETGLAYKRMGDILHTLGKNEPAEEAYRQALVLLGQLAESAPANQTYRQELANSYNWLGETLRATGHREEAHAAYKQALARQKELVLEEPKQPAYHQELSRTLYNLGILCADLNPKEAEEFYHEAIGILEKLVARVPDLPAYQQELARSYLDLGAVLGNTERFPQALAADEKAIGLLEHLVRQFPTHRDYKLELALCCNNVGNALRATRHYAAAEKAHRQAVRTLEELARDFPHVPNFRSELANASNSLGLLLDETWRLPAARAAWLAAASSYEQLVREDPDVPDYRAELGRVQGNLGWLHYQPLRAQSAAREVLEPCGMPLVLGRLVERLGWRAYEQAELNRARQHLQAGIEHLEFALQRNPENAGYRAALQRPLRVLANTLTRLAQQSDAKQAAEEYYLAARCLARIVPLVEKERASQYVQAAVTTLQQALRHGYQDFDRLRNDPSFAPLQDDHAFARLLTHP